MSWVFFVGKNYLWPKRKKRADTTLLLPALGLTVGIAALICVLSGMNSFQHLLINDLQEISSYHLRLTRPGRPVKIDDVQALAPLAKVNGVVAVTAFIEAPMLLSSSQGRQAMPLVRAVDADGFNQDQGRAQAMPLQWGSEVFTASDQLIVGSGLSYSLGVGMGDRVQLLSLGQNAAGEVVEFQRTFTIQAIYSSTTQEVERHLVFVPLSADLLPFFDREELSLGVKLASPRRWHKVAPDIQKTAGEFPFEMVSSYSYNRGFFTALRTEKTVLLLLVSMIFLVMVLQIYQSLRRLVIQHRREVALLRALGAGSGCLQGMFIAQAVGLALASMAIGSGIGVALAEHLQVILTWIGQGLRANSQSFANLQPGLLWTDVLLVNGLVLSFCLLAGYLAARPTAKMMPASILRHE